MNAGSDEAHGRFIDLESQAQTKAERHPLNVPLASLIAFSDDAIISKSLAGIITSWNPGAERLFGYTAEEAVGQSMAMLIPPELAAEEQQILERTTRGEVTDHFETVRVRKDGRKIHVWVTISPIKDDRGAIIGASQIARDITERKRAQEIVRYSEEEYRRLFETLIEGFCTIEVIFDANGKPIDYRFLEINPAFEKQTGLQNAQGKLMREIAPDHEAHWFEIYGKVALTGEPVHFENDANALGRSFDVRAYRVGAAESRKVAILFNDITERKGSQKKLQAQVQRLNLLQHITRAIGERQDILSIFQVVVRSLEEELPVDLCCIGLYDPLAQHLTVSVVGVRTPGLAQQLGLTEQVRIPIDCNGLSRCVRGQLVCEPQLDQIPYSFAQRLAQAGLRSMAAAPLLVENQVFGVLIAARRAEHSFTSAECEFLRQLSEHVALAAHQAQLYTALQKAYDELRQTQNAVMQQERLLALGQMASGIAHDINNAISPVALYTESLLTREAGLSAQGRCHLETIQRAIEDVAQTVARMREFYRQREPQMTLVAVDVNRLVPQVLELTRARWADMAQQRGVAIKAHAQLADGLPPIMGAESELREALINLIFNAVDAMPQGGQLTLRTQAVGERVQVEVIDTGLGMDEDTRRSCLEPFFTTKGERGTGLGLAMVYGTMQRHSGDIEIESVLGQGTTVRLSFAVAAASEVLPAPLPPATALPPLNILLVDDDPMVLQSLRDALTADGHEVMAADGGQAGIEAILAAQSSGSTFDAVVTDLGMPYVDGRQVARAVKTAAPNTLVIMLTGWGQRLASEGDVPHVDRLLSKPPKLRELRAALAEARPARTITPLPPMKGIVS